MSNLPNWHPEWTDPATRKHTPTPWRGGVTIDSEVILGFSGNREVLIAELGEEKDLSQSEHTANAMFILHACNSHYELVAALNALVIRCEAKTRPFDFGIAVKAARAALRAVEVTALK